MPDKATTPSSVLRTCFQCGAEMSVPRSKLAIRVTCSRRCQGLWQTATALARVEERFWSQVDAGGDCWLWTGLVDADDYGIFTVPLGSRRTKRERAHRMAWRLLVGTIDDSLTLDHLCRVHRCVNPDHLEPATRAVNTLRGHSEIVRRSRSEQCKRGHADWYVWVDSRGRTHRLCTPCREEYARTRWQSNVAARKAAS